MHAKVGPVGYYLFIYLFISSYYYYPCVHYSTIDHPFKNPFNISASLHLLENSCMAIGKFKIHRPHLQIIICPTQLFFRSSKNNGKTQRQPPPPQTYITYISQITSLQVFSTVEQAWEKAPVTTRTVTPWKTKTTTTTRKAAMLRFGRL